MFYKQAYRQKLGLKSSDLKTNIKNLRFKKF